jgi:hypothetical protein
MDSTYPISKPSDLGQILSDVSQSTKNAIVNALQQNGLLAGNKTLNVLLATNDVDSLKVNANQDKVVVLAPDSFINVNSNKPIVVAASSGTNYLDVTGQNRADTVIGGSGRDTIVGNGGRDSLVAGSGQESVSSGGGLDTIKGGSGRDTLTAGGQSSVVAGSGRTTIVAGQFEGAHDTVVAGTGADKITLTQGNNLVFGPTGGGSATITAGSGADTIRGPAAFDGAATINGGAKTTLDLGTGSVTFNLGKGDNDTVFGGQTAGFLNLNKASTDITSTTFGKQADGQTTQTFVFGSGGSITTVGTVNVTFSDTRKPTS